MPVKKSIRLLVNILSVPVIFTVIAGGCYWFTNDRATDAVAAAVLTALFILIGYALRNHLQQQGRTHKRRTKLLLSILVIGIVTVYLASCAKAATTTMPPGNKFGGYAWSKTVSRNLGYAAIPGCGWAKVWKNGYAPLGGYKDYTFSLTVHWCWTARMVSTPYGPVLGWRFVGTPFVPPPDFKARTTASWEGLVPSASVRRWEGCWIQDRWTPRGCYRIVIRAQIRHLVLPGFLVGGPEGHPTLTLVINARGVLVLADFDNSVF